MSEEHVDKRSESQFKSPYEPDSERDHRWRFSRGDETATPKDSKGNLIPKTSGFFGAMKGKK